MAYPEKWRETCDPFALAYHEFRPTEVLGYPHAGNDVFRMRGEWEGREVTAYVKVARQESANLANEVNILSQLDAPIFPRVLDCGREGFRFSVTEERPGERLSMIVGDNEDGAALSYMEEYGEALARLHAQTLKAGPRAERRFHHRPTRETLEELKLTFLDEFFADSPKMGKPCSVTGISIMPTCFGRNITSARFWTSSWQAMATAISTLRGRCFCVPVRSSCGRRKRWSAFWPDTGRRAAATKVRLGTIWRSAMCTSWALSGTRNIGNSRGIGSRK